MPLAPCPGCNRHVRLGADACPFCGCEEQPRPLDRRGRPVVGTLTRAAIFAGALLATACGPETPPEETIAQPYGAPPEPPDQDPEPEPEETNEDEQTGDVVEQREEMGEPAPSPE